MSTQDIFVHPTADVEQGCKIGKGTRIWHFCHIMKGVAIGERCTFGQNVFVATNVRIGSNVKIQNNVSVYTGTVIEDDVFLGPSCVLTNITNPRSEIVRHDLYEKTVLKRGCTIGANATVVCGTTIGRYAFVAAAAVVAKDVPDYALMIGVSAHQKGWMSRHGHRLHFDSKGMANCLESGLRYQLVDDAIVRCIDIDEEAPLPEELLKASAGYDEIRSRLRRKYT